MTQIKRLGLINDFGRIPNSKNLIGWLEFDKDGRWDKRVFSSIKILDVNTKKIIKNTLRGFFASLDISPNARENKRKNYKTFRQFI